MAYNNYPTFGKSSLGRVNVTRCIRRSTGLDLITKTGKARVQVIDDGIIHVGYTRQNDFRPAPGPMIVPQAAGEIQWNIEEDLETILIITPRLRLLINKQTGAFTWSTSTGDLLVREPDRGGKHLHEIDIEGQKYYSTRLALVFSEGEAIYGLGQHEDGVFNYRGHSEFLYQHNLKVAMPVLVSTRGYAILFDSYSLSTFHDDQYGSYFWSEVEDQLDFYFICGPEFDDLIAGIRRLTGQASLLPKWAYGYIQSKERYKRQNELVEIAQEYRRRGIGLDCIVLDWMSWPNDKWGQKSLDPERFPDPKQMVEDLHHLHTRLMVSVWPRFDNDGPDQIEMREKGFLLEDGVTYNAFDPPARSLFWKQANQGLFQHGVDAWWCDCTEPFEPDWSGPEKPEPWQRAVTNTGTFKRYLPPDQINAFALHHSRGMYEGQRAETEEKRVVNLTRSAYPGQARYGTVTWSGDITARWETFKKQIPAGLNFAITGSPRWTFDIGGFFVNNRRDQADGLWFWDGGYPNGYEDRGYRELFVRWFQMAAFLPMFRAHGTDTPREVWRFGKPGEPVYDTLVRFIHLRYRLLPYLYSLAGWETHRSYTMLRALAFDFRHDPLVYNIADQFMCGPALLVCPVTRPIYSGPDNLVIENPAPERTIYLPAGTSWYNFWTGRRYSGGQVLRTPATLDIIPLFVRAGSILPMGPAIQHSGEKVGAPIEVRVYLGGDCQFDLYDDEGDSYRYELGEFSWTSFRWEDSARTLTAGPRQGTFRGMPATQVFHIVESGEGEEPGMTAAEIALTNSGEMHRIRWG